MINSYYPTSVPAQYPVTLEEAKDVLEIVDTRHDSKITMMVSAATSKAENYTGQYFVKRTVAFNLDNVHQKIINLPVHPILSIDNIKYFKNGVQTTLSTSDYEYDTNAFPPFIKITTLPSSDQITNAIVINATAGYDNAGLIPSDIKQAILFHVYQSFLNRGNDDKQVEETFKNMLYSYRFMKL